MLRFIVILLATLAFSWIVLRAYPASANAFFVVGGLGITYIMVACLMFAVVAFKVTK